jgi:hypothetical protein
MRLPRWTARPLPPRARGQERAAGVAKEACRAAGGCAPAAANGSHLQLRTRLMQLTARPGAELATWLLRYDTPPAPQRDRLLSPRGTNAFAHDVLQARARPPFSLRHAPVLLSLKIRHSARNKTVLGFLENDAKLPSPSTPHPARSSEGVDTPLASRKYRPTCPRGAAPRPPGRARCCLMLAVPFDGAVTCLCSGAVRRRRHVQLVREGGRDASS